jgi:DNA-binding response OmpR family regulator
VIGYPRTVLVVDDAGTCAATLEIALAQITGLNVRVVSSAEEARAELDRDTGVCAVVTDVHLPEASGLDLIRWVRSRERWSRMPIVVVSGDSDPDTPAASLRLGADAYFAKPFSPSEVRRKLEDLIDAETSTPPVQ